MIYWALLLLILGMVFISIELFVPGFGFFGITGLIMFALSCIITIFYINYGIFIVVSEIIFFVLIGCIIFHFIKKRNLNGTIILNESLKEDKKEDYHTFIGREGISKTPLKPFGKADFYGNTIDVCAESFVESGKKVVAVRFYEGKLYVKSLSE